MSGIEELIQEGAGDHFEQLARMGFERVINTPAFFHLAPLLCAKARER